MQKPRTEAKKNDRSDCGKYSWLTDLTYFKKMVCVRTWKWGIVSEESAQKNKPKSAPWKLYTSALEPAHHTGYIYYTRQRKCGEKLEERKSFIEKGQIQDVIYIINYVSQLSVLSTGLSSTLLTLIRGIIEVIKNLGKSWVSLVVTKPNLCSAITEVLFRTEIVIGAVQPNLLDSHRGNFHIYYDKYNFRLSVTLHIKWFNMLRYKYQKSTGRSDRFLKVLLARHKSELT